MKTLIKLATLVFVLTAFLILSGCSSDEVTNPPQPQVDRFSVDATVDQGVVHAGDFVTPHADGRGGTAPYSFCWYQRGEWIGVGEEPAPQQMNREGFYTFLVVGTDSLGAVAQDSVVVTVLPAEVQPLSIDLEAIPAILEVGNYTYLHTHVVGGVKPYRGYTFYKDGIQMGDNQVGWFRMMMDQQGSFNLRVTVIDSLGTAASDSAIVSVVAPNIIEACVDTDLKVGPNGRDDFEEVYFGQTGTGNVTVAMKFDTTERRFVVFGLHYADGTTSYFTIPDIGTTRPSMVLVDLGQVRVEPTTTISMRWTGSPSKDLEKCTQWVTATQFCLSLEGPNKAVDGIPIIRLGKGGNYIVE